MGAVPGADRRRGLEPRAGGSTGGRHHIVVGQGSTWTNALTDVAWLEDEVLVVGTSSSSLGRLFLGSHAAKIVRRSPVPVMLVPRSIVDKPASPA